MEAAFSNRIKHPPTIIGTMQRRAVLTILGTLCSARMFHKLEHGSSARPTQCVDARPCHRNACTARDAALGSSFRPARAAARSTGRERLHPLYATAKPRHTGTVNLQNWHRLMHKATQHRPLTSGRALRAIPQVSPRPNQGLHAAGALPHSTRGKCRYTTASASSQQPARCGALLVPRTFGEGRRPS